MGCVCHSSSSLSKYQLFHKHGHHFDRCYHICRYQYIPCCFFGRYRSSKCTQFYIHTWRAPWLLTGQAISLFCEAHKRHQSSPTHYLQVLVEQGTGLYNSELSLQLLKCSFDVWQEGCLSRRKVLTFGPFGSEEKISQFVDRRKCEWWAVNLDNKFL